MGRGEREMMLDDYKRALYWILFQHYLSLIARLSSLMANQAEVLPNTLPNATTLLAPSFLWLINDPADAFFDRPIPFSVPEQMLYVFFNKYRI